MELNTGIQCGGTEVRPILCNANLKNIVLLERKNEEFSYNFVNYRNFWTFSWILVNLVQFSIWFDAYESGANHQQANVLTSTRKWCKVSCSDETGSIFCVSYVLQNFCGTICIVWTKNLACVDLTVSLDRKRTTKMTKLIWKNWIYSFLKIHNYQPRMHCLVPKQSDVKWYLVCTQLPRSHDASWMLVQVQLAVQLWPEFQTEYLSRRHHIHMPGSYANKKMKLFEYSCSETDLIFF